MSVNIWGQDEQVLPLVGIGQDAIQQVQDVLRRGFAAAAFQNTC